MSVQVFLSVYQDYSQQASDEVNNYKHGNSNCVANW